MIILRFGHENIFTIILPLPLILKEEQLSVNGEKYTLYIVINCHRKACLGTVWLGCVMTELSDMTSAVYLGRLKAKNQTKLPAS